MALCRLVFLALVSCTLAEDPKIYFVEKFEGGKWFKSLYCSAQFCQFRLLQQAYIFYHSDLNFQSKVTKIDGLNLLSREVTVENSCGLLENFTAMLT